MIRPPRPATADVPWRWAAAGAVLGLVLVLVLAAPARWLAAVVAQANGDVRARGEAARHLANFHALVGNGAIPAVRHIKRTQNLAGIALARGR